ncbi:MAG: DUF1702 family protein [Acidobacteriota bacterium]
MPGFVPFSSGFSPRRLAARFLAISPREAAPAVRGFEVEDPEVEDRLQRIGHTFLQGYHAALEEPSIHGLSDRLDRVEAGWRGFAYEGAGMGLMLFDSLFGAGLRRRKRSRAFVDGPADPHRYLAIVGAGWALARVPRRIESVLRVFDPTVAWLVLDGYGFHHGFFSWPRTVEGRRVPRRLKGYARHAFDQGLGRSLWFVRGASPRRIAETVARFPRSRRDGLWSGVGLACAYAGGIDDGAIQELRRVAGPWRAQLAQGAAFAAAARRRASEVTPATERACTVLCGLGAEEAATLVEEILAEIQAADTPTLHGPPEPTYETWRRSVREALAPEVPASETRAPDDAEAPKVAEAEA